MNLKYNRSSYDSGANRKRKYLMENKQEISGYAAKKEIKLIQALSENEEEIIQEKKYTNTTTVVKKEEPQLIERKKFMKNIRKSRRVKKLKKKKKIFKE